MRVVIGLRALHRDAQARPDDGVTLLEVMVSTAILGVAVAIFGAGAVQMYRSAATSEALTVAQTQMHVAFQRLDRDLRYADAISGPSSEPDGNGDWYVEYLSEGTETAVCTQLRLRTRLSDGEHPRLQQRSWPAGQAPGETTWHTLATNVATDGSPFTLIDAGEGGSLHQRLEVLLNASAGGPRRPAAAQTKVTFTALNTSVDTADPTTCSRHRSAS